MNGRHATTPGTFKSVAGMMIVLPLSGCIMGPGIDETILPTRIDYSCSGGRVLQVARTPDGFQAATLVDGERVNLRRMDSAAQEKYGDGRYLLYLDGDRAMLELDGKVLYGPCVSTMPLPSAPRYR